MVDRIDDSIVSVLLHDQSRYFAVKNRRRERFDERFNGRFKIVERNIREEIRVVRCKKQQHKAPSERGLHQCAGQLSMGQSEGRESLQGFLLSKLKFYLILNKRVWKRKRKEKSSTVR